MASTAEFFARSFYKQRSIRYAMRYIDLLQVMDEMFDIVLLVVRRLLLVSTLHSVYINTAVKRLSMRNPEDS